MIRNTFLDVDKQESYAGQEPITLSEAKAHLRVDFSDDDTIISDLITAARQAIEAYCHISIVQKTVTLTINSQEELQTVFFNPYQVREAFNSFELPYGPIVSVDAVTSIDSDGTTVISCALNADYFLQGALFKTIKISNSFTNNILVYTVGFGAKPIPRSLIRAILNEVAYRYAERGEPTGVRATAYTAEGVCKGAEVLAFPFRRLTTI